jgi:hypothetical protein
MTVKLGMFTMPFHHPAGGTRSTNGAPPMARNASHEATASDDAVLSCRHSSAMEGRR